MTQQRVRRGPRWLRSFLIALLVLLLATLAASFFWQPAFLKNNGVASLRGFEALHAQQPAAILSATAAALGGADFELLDDPDAERIARDLDLCAWYAAGTNAPATDTNPTPAPLPEDTAPETSAPETEENGGAQ